MDYVAILVATVERATAELLAMPADIIARRPAPGKWSPKQIVGHLIDSAMNNHQRFMRAQWQEDLVFPGYDQDAWVATQRYHEVPWAELVTLWRALNLHVARVMVAIPDAVRTRVHDRHSLDRIAWQTLAADQPATLDYLMQDYVAHLQHHLRQLEARRSRLVARP